MIPRNLVGATDLIIELRKRSAWWLSFPSGHQASLVQLASVTRLILSSC